MVMNEKLMWGWACPAEPVRGVSVASGPLAAAVSPAWAPCCGLLWGQSLADNYLLDLLL